MKKSNYIFKIFIMLIFVSICNLSYGQEIISGYIKADAVYFEGEYKIQKGQYLKCSVSKNRKECCFEEEIGTICIPMENINYEKVPKLDLRLDNVVFLDLHNLSNNACIGGRPLKNRSDAYIWSIGFTITSSEYNEDPVMVEMSYYLTQNNQRLYKPTVTKKWMGKIDGECKSLIITKEDIDTFLMEYQKYRDYLQVEHDLNLDVMVSVRLFSKRIESNYKNNVVEFESIIPADNSEAWPFKREGAVRRE